MSWKNEQKFGPMMGGDHNFNKLQGYKKKKKPATSEPVQEAKESFSQWAVETAKIKLFSEVAKDTQKVFVFGGSDVWQESIENLSIDSFPEEGESKKIIDYAELMSKAKANTPTGFIEGYYSGGMVIGSCDCSVCKAKTVDPEYLAKRAAAGELSRASFALPSIKQAVDYPCECMELVGGPQQASLRSVIMHLNDSHARNGLFTNEVWTREDIADWLDKLHDDGKINIEFSPWEEETTIETLGVNNVSD